MKLVVVESPAKVKTIKKYLGKGYKVKASMGHFVDLPKSKLGVDIENDFEPEYVVTNREALKSLKDAFKNADTLIIASDLDREGESIGWHVARQLKVIDKAGRRRSKSKKISRIVFSSITKDAVEAAVNNPRKLDIDLIEAQQARRILDRLVGYKLSPLLWKKIKYGLSAGRVQSVAVRLIVDREDERDKFKPKEYWFLLADVLKSKSKKKVQEIYRKKNKDKDETERLNFKGIKFQLVKIEGKKADLKKENDVKKAVKEVIKKDWTVSSVKKKEKFRYPKPPFITSTLQRKASGLLGYSAKRTMSTAQKLYEAGYITYMRTDSLNIVSKELKKIRKYIDNEFGKEYVNKKLKRYKTKSKGAQEAHEAIRPTDITKNASDLSLRGGQRRLYNLIRSRTLACQMSPAKVESTVIFVEIGKYLFQANGQRILFQGFLKAYTEKISENILPEIDKGDRLYPTKLIGEQHFTSPPPRFSEATLIKTLENYGIGRPSTYAPIISTILARKYVVKEGKYFKPTITGKVVNSLLKKYFSDIVDTGFTAEMEDSLDDIAEGKKKRNQLIKSFYKDFAKDLKVAEKKITRDEFTIVGKSRYKCPECGNRMVKKLGRYGLFLSCPDFPKCKGMRSIEGKTEKDKKEEAKKISKSDDFKKKYLPAPKTKDGKMMILKFGRYGKFWAHPDYPKVKKVKPVLLKRKCPKCGSPLLERKGKWGKPFIGCSGYPKCRFIEKIKSKKKK